VKAERRGVGLLVGAALSFSVMSVFVKEAGKTLPVEMLVLARAVVTLVLSSAVLVHQRIPIWGNDKPWLVVRGLLGVGGLVCFFTAVTRLPLAEVTTIHYLNPIFTTALAAVFLKEHVRFELVIAIAMAFAGTLLVARPSFLFGGGEGLDTLGVIAALGGALFSAGAYTTVRRLTKTDHHHVIVFYFPLVAVPILLPFAVTAWVWPTWQGWLLLLGIGIATQIAQVLFTRGLALVPAGRGTAVGYVQIAFAAAFGLLLFDEPLTFATAGGALLIVLATISLLRR
jgi:drug/metabolite transporter (DMT)-like permease